MKYRRPLHQGSSSVVAEKPRDANENINVYTHNYVESRQRSRDTQVIMNIVLRATAYAIARICHGSIKSKMAA